MMKKLLLLGVLGLAILAGCAQQNQTAKVIQEETSMTTDQIFQKKVECSKLKKNIQENLEKNGYSDWKLNSVFYSKEKNSCLYLIDGSTANGSRQIVQDAFTDQEIVTSRCGRNDPENNPFECIMNPQKFEKRLEELQAS